MSHRYTLGIDFGGSSSKATLLEDTGRIISTSSKEYPSYYPFAGWVEQDADELLNAFIENTKTCLEKSKIYTGDIVAIAIDAATHMAVLCGKDDKPLRKFIHWSDCRSTKEVAFLKKEYESLLKENSVNSISAAWTLPQLLWIQNNEPDILAKTQRVYFAKDYIRHKITGDFLTDNIEAMGSMLANDYNEEWSEELCKIVGLNRSSLPKITTPKNVAGYVSKEISELTGLKAGTPVIVGSTDTVMEVYASGAISIKNGTVKMATAGRICPITKDPVNSHQFFNYKHIIPGLWYPGTGTRTCASSYRWYRTVFGGKYPELNEEAEKIPAGCDGLIFHPFLQGEMTPYYDDSLCASFTGVRMHHTKAYFNRAILEGVAYSMRDSLEQIKAMNIEIDQFRVLGGGAKSILWRKILSDVLNVPLTCTVDNDSSLGSAMLAGVATGLYSNYTESVEKCVIVSDITVPIEDNVKIYDEKFKEYKSIVNALQPIYNNRIP